MKINGKLILACAPALVALCACGPTFFFRLGRGPFLFPSLFPSIFPSLFPKRK